MNYTVDDYNKTIHRGFVHPITGKILWGKNPALKTGLEWRTPKAYAKNVKQKTDSRRKRSVLHQNRINKIKTDCGCEMCGMTHEDWPENFKDGFSYFLQFDHIDPATKQYNVSAITTYAWKTIIAEIKKCRVLCFRCHAIYTGKQNRKDDADELLAL